MEKSYNGSRSRSRARFSRLDILIPRRELFLSKAYSMFYAAIDRRSERDINIVAYFPLSLSFVRHYRYHYREAVVVSALQVLKYPLTMPGPSSTASANNSTSTPPTRHLPTYYVPPTHHQQAWSETLSDGRTSKLGGAFSTNSNTPIHSPSPHRPNHSPKIKLK